MFADVELVERLCQPGDDVKALNSKGHTLRLAAPCS